MRALTSPILAKEAFRALRPWARAVEAPLLAPSDAEGYCRGCSRIATFRTAAAAPGEWINLLEGLRCDCGLNGRMRLILSVLDAMLDAGISTRRAAVFERVTPLFPHLERRLPGLSGSEYLGDDVPRGAFRHVRGVPVRNEDIANSTYTDRSLDLVMHFDVLEHVPDHRAALRECHRILAPGGRLLFSCPFYDALEKTIRRAEVRDGRLLHLMEPCYHGNPVDGSGALVFIHPGWDVWDALEEAGFRDVALVLNYCVDEGIVSNACPYADGHMWPVVFSATRPQDNARPDTKL